MVLREAPFNGLVVIDFTHILAGPYCTRLLADGGANVIKVEPPGGETARRRGAKRFGPNGRESSAYHAFVNLGKRSIAVNLKVPEGAEIARKLIGQADVVVENFVPGVLSRLGVDLAVCRRSNPRLITVSISLDGSFGPVGGATEPRRGFAAIAEAESGLLNARRGKDGTPVAFGLPIGDVVTALTAYAAITTSLVSRAATGVGGHHDIGLVNCMLPLSAPDFVNYQFSGSDERTMDTAAYGLFKASDGWITLGAYSDHLWRSLLEEAGDIDVADDLRHASYEERSARAAEVNALVEQWTRRFPAKELIARLTARGIPCGHVNSPEELYDLALGERAGLFEEVQDGLGGTVHLPLNPMGISYNAHGYSSVGENGREILGEVLRVGDAEFNDLLELGAVIVPS